MGSNSIVAPVDEPIYVLLNGPPRCGKDTAAQALLQAFSGSVHEKFSRPLKAAFAGIMNVPMDKDFNVEGYEAAKEERLKILAGYTYRNFQQQLSEQFLKKFYGESIFGDLLYNRTVGIPAMFIVSDCGFQVEVNTLTELVSPQRVLLIRIHRKGCNYSSDTRQSVSALQSHNLDIPNDGEMADFQRRVVGLVDWWLEARL